MKIAVVIPSYNRRPYIRECIESCFSQSLAAGDEVEVVVSDDGSRDGTVASLRETYALDTREGEVRLHSRPGLFVLEGPNGERGAARNRGAWFAIRERKADWILFLDSDDRLAPGTLARFRERMDRIPPGTRVAALYARVQEWYGGDRMGPELSRGGHEGDLFRILIGKSLMPMGACLVASDAFERTGGFSEDRLMSGSEDWHFGCRLSLRGRIFYSDHVSAHYRRHEDNTPAHRFKDSIQLSRARMRFEIEKHFGAEAPGLIRIMMRQASLGIAGTFNEHREAGPALRFAGRALAQDPFLLVKPSYWRLLASIMWRSKGRFRPARPAPVARR